MHAVTLLLHSHALSACELTSIQDGICLGNLVGAAGGYNRHSPAASVFTRLPTGPAVYQSGLNQDSWKACTIDVRV